MKCSILTLFFTGVGKRMITLQWSETALEFLHEDIPGSEGMVPVFSIDNGQYQWERMLALFSSSTKKFYWAVNSGCECCDDSSKLATNTDGMASGNELELKRAIRNFIAHSPEIITDEEKQKIFSKIKKQK